MSNPSTGSGLLANDRGVNIKTTIHITTRDHPFRLRMVYEINSLFDMGLGVIFPEIQLGRLFASPR
jgi:hypothetical protein